MAPSSPKREQNGELGSSVGHSTPREKERPRSFDEKTRTACWRKAAVLTGRHPERWRQDPAGNIVCRRFWSCHGCLCYEYDHIVPFSKGGKSTVDNCQILQTRVNRSKSDKAWVEQAEMQGFSCDMKFTESIGEKLQTIVCSSVGTLLDHESRLKFIRDACIKRIKRSCSGLRTLLYNHCRIKEVNELFQFRIMQLSSDLLEFWSDKELDIIEMAVYGDVVRPGKQCRCRTVAEMLGKVKSKDHMPPCDLPYNDAS